MSKQTPSWLPALFGEPHERYKPITPAKKQALLQALTQHQVPLHLACKMAGVSESAVDDLIALVDSGHGTPEDEKFVIAVNMALSLVEKRHVQTLEEIFTRGEMGAVKAGEMLLRAFSPEKWGGTSDATRRARLKMLQTELELAKVKTRVAKRLEKDDLAKRRQEDIQKSRLIGMSDALSTLKASNPALHAQLLAELKAQGIEPVTKTEEEEIQANRDPGEDTEIAELAKRLGVSEQDVC